MMEVVESPDSDFATALEAEVTVMPVSSPPFDNGIKSPDSARKKGRNEQEHLWIDRCTRILSLIVVLGLILLGILAAKKIGLTGNATPKSEDSTMIFLPLEE